jgi:hypothetical protein
MRALILQWVVGLLYTSSVHAAVDPIAWVRKIFFPASAQTGAAAATPAVTGAPVVSDVTALKAELDTLNQSIASQTAEIAQLQLVIGQQANALKAVQGTAATKVTDAGSTQVMALQQQLAAEQLARTTADNATLVPAPATSAASAATVVPMSSAPVAQTQVVNAAAVIPSVPVVPAQSSVAAASPVATVATPPPLKTANEVERPVTADRARGRAPVIPQAVIRPVAGPEAPVNWRLKRLGKDEEPST